MYTDFYKFSGRPFQLNPDARFFYGSRNHQKALAYLTFGLNQGEGFIVITGDIGAGKSTLVQHLLGQLDPKKYVAAKVVTTQTEADDTLRMVASAFNVAFEGLDKATLLRRLERFLLDCHAAGKRALLLIDEAQNLPAGSLEELRMLSNFQQAERAILQSYLLGQPQFRATLASPDLEQLRQRIIASYHLGPMEEPETRAYIEHRLKVVGWKDDPAFSDDAFEAIYGATEGVPRRINTLCSRILLFGALEERHRIDTAAVREVVADLQQENAQGGPVRPRGNGAAAPANGHAGATAAPAGMDAVLQRIELLEKYVQSHDRAIKRALDMAVTYLDSGKARHD